VSSCIDFDRTGMDLKRRRIGCDSGKDQQACNEHDEQRDKE